MAQPAPSPMAWYDGAPSPAPPGWALNEAPVPESPLHADILLLMQLLLQAWAERAGRPAYVARNLALRWLEAQPKVGLDPDLALYAPPPAGGAESLASVRTWLPGHAPPRVALEVVSPGHPTKDYAEAPLRYAASGAGELWVFDPLLAGPRALGGPHRLQVWARNTGGRFERVYAGEGPARSPHLGAWLVVTEGGKRLRLSDDAKGRRLWPTGEEAERRAREAERQAREAAEAHVEAERRAKDEALEELARLRAEVAALRGGGGR